MHAHRKDTEAEHSFSIRSLGPLVVGFAVLLLAAVMYRAIRNIGGSLAAITLSLGLSLLIGWVIGIPSLVSAEVLQTITTVALLVGILALVIHRHARHDWFPQRLHTVPTVRNDLRSLYRDQHLADRLAHNLRHVRREAGRSRFSPAEPLHGLLKRTGRRSSGRALAKHEALKVT